VKVIAAVDKVADFLNFATFYKKNIILQQLHDKFLPRDAP